MQVTLEFFGISRLVVGSKELSLDLEDGTTFREIVRLLSTKYPPLMENVVSPDGETLQEPNIFNQNAQRMIKDSEMDGAVQDGDRIILMSMAAGG